MFYKSFLFFKPLWKLLVDMDPQTLVSCIDFRYITDVLTEEEACEILRQSQVGKKRARGANAGTWLPRLHHVVCLAGLP